jgi:GNAT superfamily N-acetyltransferase
MILTTHNPPYYERLVEAQGFSKAMDFYAWWFANPERARKRLLRLASALKERHPVSIRPVNLRQLDAESALLRELYNKAWQNNWGFVPFTAAEFDYMAHSMKPLVIPDLTLIAEVNGEPAGFILTLPDVNAALRHLKNGRLTSFGLPIGLAKLLYHKRRLKRMRLVALGIVPKYRRSGIAEMLVLRVIETGMIERGYFGECSMTLENNYMINRFLEAIGAENYKTYRIYSRRLS